MFAVTMREAKSGSRGNRHVKFQNGRNDVVMQMV
jgi:hypothetical protein